MSTPIHAMMEGSFTTGATLAPVFISLPAGYTSIKIYNDTDIAAGGAGINIVEGKDTFPANNCITYTGVPLVPAINNTNGITFVQDTGSQAVGPAIVNAAGGITNAAPPVVTSGTLYPVGSVIRLSNTTAALQLSGMDYEVTVSGAGTMTLGMVATAPGSAATANTLRLVNANARYYPKSRFITGITQAAQAVIAMSVTHGFTVGQDVRIIIPDGWGMTQLNGTLARIVAIGTAFGGAGTTNTITIDVDTTAMTAFAYPSSLVASLGVGVPQVVPVGEAAISAVANNLDDATVNISKTGVIVDSAVLIASKSYSWVAQKSMSI